MTTRRSRYHWMNIYLGVFCAALMLVVGIIFLKADQPVPAIFAFIVVVIGIGMSIWNYYRRNEP